MSTFLSQSLDSQKKVRISALFFAALPSVVNRGLRFPDFVLREMNGSSRLQTEPVVNLLFRSLIMLKRVTSLWLCLLSFSPVFGLPATAAGEANENFYPSQSTPQIATLVINEYLADPPDTIAGDANGDGTRNASQDEFVELVNYGLVPLNIGGFTISDATQQRFSFPAGKIIPAGESAVVFGGGRPTGSFGNAMVNGLVFTASGLSLDNGGDTIMIKDNSGMSVDSRSYPSADGSANQSITRSPDISGGFVRHSQATGSNGALFSPGTRINGMSFSDGPRITQISPDQVLQSNSPFDLNVSGINFDPSALVLIDFIAVPTDFSSSTNLKAAISASIASTAGHHRVEVVNPDGNLSNALTLTIIPPPPVLHELSPMFVELGSGPFTVVLQGENFTPASRVLVEGTTITTFFNNARELLATVPLSFTNTLGTYRVRVRNGDGQLSGELAFQVVPKSPRLNGLKPSQTVAGSPAFTLAIAGANFNTSSTVLFNQTPLATKFISSASLTAEVPASLITNIGLKAVAVQSDDGVISNEIAFRVFAITPLLGAVTPDAAIEGSGEQMLELVGERFKKGAIVRALKNSQLTPPLDAAFVSSERIEAKLPASLLQTPGSLFIRVENPDFGFSNEFVFKVFIKDPLVINEYLADPPDQIAGDANGDGSRSTAQDEFVEIVNRTSQAIDISGYKLFDADTVRHLFAPSTIIPPFEAVVVFGGGRPQGKFGNTFENLLVFTASSGGLSLNNGGDTIKLEDATGRTVQEIKFGPSEGNASESINRDPDGDGALFTTHQRVTGTDKKFSPGAKARGEPFTLRPAINALSPASIHARSATFSLMISGTNFQPGAVVSLAQAELATVYQSETELEARVGAELLMEGGLFEVRVQNPRGETSGNAKFFIFDEPPGLAAINPKKTGTGAENLEITIQGERFQRGAVVTIANEKVATKFIQAAGQTASLVAIAPEKFFTAAANLELRVINEDANVSNAMTLTVENGPLITRISRTKIKAGRGAVDLSFSGVAFDSAIVLFVDDKPVPTTFVNETSFTARIPAEMTNVVGQLTIQARHTDGGRSNKIKIKVVE
jgi:hypothetical protein